MVNTTIDLVKSAKNGNRYSFNLIINQYQNDIYRFCFYRVTSKMDAEDLTQDIFIKAFRLLGSLKDPEKFRPWLYRIALNTIRDFYRKKKLILFADYFTNKFRRDDGSEEDTGEVEIRDQETTSGDMDKRDFWNHISDFTSCLSKKEKDVFIFRYYDDMTLKETAHILDKSESTVKTHLYRAIAKFRKNKRLRNLLREYENET